MKVVTEMVNIYDTKTKVLYLEINLLIFSLSKAVGRKPSMYELNEIASSGKEYIIQVKSYEKLQKAIRRAAYAKIGKLM